MKSTKKILAMVLIMILTHILIVSQGVGLSVSAAAGDKANPSGAYIKYTVDVNKPEGETLAYNWLNFKRIDYVFQEGDMVEYDVMFNVEDKGWGHIDGAVTGCPTTTVFRDIPNSGDQNNVPYNTAWDMSDYAYGVWYHRVLDVTDSEENIGIKWTTFQIGCYPVSDDLEYQCVTLYDNIVITNNGEVKLVIFKDEQDWPETRIGTTGTSNCKAVLEMGVFTQDELDGFKAVEEAKIAEEAAKAASREASKAEAEASREASREQARIDESIEASIKESEEAARETDAGSGSSNESEGGRMILIIAIACGAVVVIIVIIGIVAAGKKKKGASEDGKKDE